jgi:glucose dehydrogenase
MRIRQVMLCGAGVVLVSGLLVAQAPPSLSATSSSSWGYGGGPEQQRYSSLTQINRSNVRELEVAWTYDTGEPGAMQTQPVVVGDVLYGYTPTHKTFALNAATGARLWLFDPGIRGSGPNRGVMYWADGDDRRVFAAVDNFIYALTAVSEQASLQVETQDLAFPVQWPDNRRQPRKGVWRNPDDPQGRRRLSLGIGPPHVRTSSPR